MTDVPGGAAEALMREIHDAHARALWGYALRLTGGDRARAADVVQETMLRAWRTPQVLDQSQRSARAWLFTVARRIMIDEWRSARSRHEIVSAQVPDIAGPDATDSVPQSWLVADALQQLSEEHRAVLVECYYRARSVAEAAMVLGIPPGTVTSRSHYAMRTLRSILDEMGVNE